MQANAPSGVADEGIRRIPSLIGRLFDTVRELSEICPGRPFTPDGHLVGSIGEVVAAYVYGLTLERCSNQGFDARCDGERSVEIKLTGCNGVWVSSDPPTPDLLIVLRLDREKGFEEIYNGEFPLELWSGKKPSKRRVVGLTLNELRKINPSLLPERHPWHELNEHFPAGVPTRD